MGFFSRDPSKSTPIQTADQTPHRSVVSDSRTYRVYPSTLSLSEAFRKVYQHLRDECGYAEECKGDCIRFSVKVDDTRHLRAWNSSEFLRILKDVKSPEYVVTHSHWYSGGKFLFALGVSVNSRDVEATVDSLDLNVIGGVHDAVRTAFEASNPSVERSPLLSRYSLKKTVFLAHRFDSQGTDAARNARLFLARLGHQPHAKDATEGREFPFTSWMREVLEEPIRKLWPAWHKAGTG